MDDQQRVEFAHQANAFVGTFVVKVFTKLRETKVVEQFTAVPEDGQVFEKTKRRICCALPPDAEGGEAGNAAKVVRKFETPESGLVETGLPVASLEVSYDDLVGTRARHWGQREFQVPRLREAGVRRILSGASFATHFISRCLKRCFVRLSQMVFQGRGEGTKGLWSTSQRRRRMSRRR